VYTKKRKRCCGSVQCVREKENVLDKRLGYGSVQCIQEKERDAVAVCSMYEKRKMNSAKICSPDRLNYYAHDIDLSIQISSNPVRNQYEGV
jgi:hypothetical protein